MKRVVIGSVLIAAVAAATAYTFADVEDARPVYLTAPIERGKLVATVTATGTVKAVVTVEVGSQLSGQIDRLYVDFNDTVQQGQPIARLDQRSFLAKVQEAEAALEAAKTSVLIQQAAVQRARSNLASARAQSDVLRAKSVRARAAIEAAKRDLGRMQQLRRKGAAAERQLDQARTAHDVAAADVREAEAEQSVHAQEIATADADLQKAQAELLNARAVVTQKEAALEQARVELERTVIRSPINGVIIGRDVDRGQTVAASLKAPTLFKIAQDLHKMEVHAKIDEADIGRVRLGQPATFRVDAFSGRRFSGTVTQIRKAPEVKKNVVTYTVVITAGNPDLLLLPGMTALVQVIVKEADGVLKLPNAALRFRPPSHEESDGVNVSLAPDSDATKTRVWLLDDNGEPRPVRVRLGLSNATATAIDDGALREGQKVIVGMAPSKNKQRLFGFRLGF